MGRPDEKPETRISTNECSPLLPKPYSVSPINETYEGLKGLGRDSDYGPAFFGEVKTLARYTLPVFGCVSHFRILTGQFLIYIQDPPIGGTTTRRSPQYLYSNPLHQYSVLVAGTVSIGHISTKALAAATLGSMTASVTGFYIMQGFLSSLDTLLPSAWTSSNPQLVGLWCQRVCTCPKSPPSYVYPTDGSFITAVVLFLLLFVSLTYNCPVVQKLIAISKPISAIWIQSESILLALKQDPEVAHLAATYLRWSLLGLPAYGFNNIAMRYFQSQGLFGAPTRIIIIVAPINVILNYLLGTPLCSSNAATEAD